MDKYKNKYRIPSARAPWWDYRNDESYQKITQYILNNPINWKDDKFFKTK